MHADLIVFADAANVTAEGKLNILGEFNVIFFPNVPGTWPLMSLVLRLECTTAEGPIHRLALRFVDEDGQIVSPNFESEINFGQPFRPGMPHRLQLIVPIGNSVYPRFGTYELEVLIDNVRIASRAMHVLDLRERQGPAA